MYSVVIHYLNSEGRADARPAKDKFDVTASFGGQEGAEAYAKEMLNADERTFRTEVFKTGQSTAIKFFEKKSLK